MDALSILNAISWILTLIFGCCALAVQPKNSTSSKVVGKTTRDDLQYGILPGRNIVRTTSFVTNKNRRAANQQIAGHMQWFIFFLVVSVILTAIVMNIN